MFDKLIEVAKAHGNGDLLEGLKYMDNNLEDFGQDIQGQFRVFMNMGARMFAPVEA